VWATTLASLAGTDGPRSRRGSIRILVVDDSNDLTGLIAIWLEDEGYAVVTATSGREALDAASVYYPDIVLLDLIMPPPDGFAVCAALRSSLPPQVILMTGLSDDEHVRRALDLGVVALLRKPLTREGVVDAINVAAERYQRDPLSKLRWHFGMHPRA
jgi:DNA-binding response OmpR family regulator